MPDTWFRGTATGHLVTPAAHPVISSLLLYQTDPARRLIKAKQSELTTGVGQMENTSRNPTRKWLATQITALTALLVAWVAAGAWDRTLTIALIGLISQALVGYLIPNGGQSNGSSATGGAPAPLVAAATQTG